MHQTTPLHRHRHASRRAIQVLLLTCVAAQKTRRAELQLQLQFSRNSKKRAAAASDDADIAESSADDSAPVAPRICSCCRARTRSGRQQDQGFFVSTLTKMVCVVDVYPDDTVERLKQLIFNATGVIEGQQRLIFADKQLDDGRTLADYNIVFFSHVRMVLRCEDADQ
jgi:large subunit ribosomal protein L40e